MAQSYKDPLYAGLTGSVENKLDLPPGLLLDIVTKGEKSNADQVSEKGAKTVFQVIPSTRDLVLKRYGVDAYLSPENAALAAGYVLRDGVNFAKRKTDNPDEIRRLAAGYYHAGGDEANWGKKTEAYMDRVQPSTYERLKAEKNAPAGTSLGAQYQAYKSGAMSTEQKAAFEKDVADGNIVLPGAMKVGAPVSGTPAPKGALDAYITGRMAEADKAEFEGLIKDGTFSLPQGQTLDMLLKRGEIPKGGTTAPAYTGSDPEMARLQQGGAAPTAAQNVRGAAELLNIPFALAGGAVGGVLGAGEALATGKPVMDTAALRAGQGAVGMMPIPPTQAGQELMGNIASSGVMQNLQALGPAGLVSTLGTQAVGAGMSTARQMAPVLASEALQAAKPAVARAVEAMRPAAVKPAQAAGGSVGAAGADVAALRRERAAQLDVPIDLTEGQATREFGAQQFEREMAKNAELGAPIRERMASQNEALQANLSRWIDQTGAESPDLRGAGKIVVDAFEKGAKRAKAEERLKYRKAELAGELEGPVQLDSLVAHLNDQGPETITSPVLRYARDKAVQIGAAEVGQDGALVAKPLPLKNAEILRRAIGNEAGTEKTNIRQASMMRGLIDESTTGAGGQLYKEARAAHSRFMQNFENVGLIDAAMSLKRGSSDRRIAFEDVFEKMVLNSSRDELGQVRRVLQTQAGPQGEQAWRELQGATVAWIKEQATKNVARDEMGRAIVSPAGLDKAIKSLDADGKLNFIFGKNGAQKMRDLNDIAKDVFVAPPGSVNSSNTASVLMAIIETGVMGAVSGMPVPLLSAGKEALKKVKDRKLRARIERALRKQ